VQVNLALHCQHKLLEVKTVTRTIKLFPDGSCLEYDKGNFDDWCIYLVNPNTNQRVAPRDIHYFEAFQKLSKKYGNDKIYRDFVSIYDKTGANLDLDVLAFITQLAHNQYQPDAFQMDQLFTTVYAGMVAEENKKNAILKKRIKRLGMHQLLIEQVTPFIAANFSKGKKWRDLDAECKNRDF
jgi:hypothetical protein